MRAIMLTLAIYAAIGGLVAWPVTSLAARFSVFYPDFLVIGVLIVGTLLVLAFVIGERKIGNKWLSNSVSAIALCLAAFWLGVAVTR